MAYSVTSSKTDQTYYLHHRNVTLRGGRQQTIYFFSRDVFDGSLDAMPVGYFADEHPGNGLPMLRKVRASPREEGVVIALGIEQGTAAEAQGLQDEFYAELAKNRSIDFLISEVITDPNAVYELDPRQFEKLIARVYERIGFSVELTAFRKDGGIDIIASRADTSGPVMHLIQCKRVGRNRKVGVEAVRALYGVAESEGATLGVLVASGAFTKGAQMFEEKHQYRLHLTEYLALLDKLNVTM